MQPKIKKTVLKNSIDSISQVASTQLDDQDCVQNIKMRKRSGVITT